MRGFDHATILSPSFQGVRKERLAQLHLVLWPQNDKTVRGFLPDKLAGGVWHASWNPYPISNQNLRFSLPYFRPDQRFDTQFQTPRPGAWRVTGARDKLLRHVHGSWRKH